jgi:hypothetical protein
VRVAFSSANPVTSVRKTGVHRCPYDSAAACWRKWSDFPELGRNSTTATTSTPSAVDATAARATARRHAASPSAIANATAAADTSATEAAAAPGVDSSEIIGTTAAQPVPAPTRSKKYTRSRVERGR